MAYSAVHTVEPAPVYVEESGQSPGRVRLPKQLALAAAFLVACMASAALPATPAPLSPDMQKALAIVPAAEATAVAIKDGPWSDPATWQDGTLPAEGGKVVLHANVVLDVSPPPLAWIRGVTGSLSPAGGSGAPRPPPAPPDRAPNPAPPAAPATPTVDDLLSFVALEKRAEFRDRFEKFLAANYPGAPKPKPQPAAAVLSPLPTPRSPLAQPVSAPAEKLTLRVETFVTEMGFKLFSTDDAAPLEIIFTDPAPIDLTRDPWAFSRGAILMGSVDLNGREVTPYQFTTGSKKGDTSVTLKNPVTGWRVGDRLVMPGVIAALKPDQFGGIPNSGPTVNDDDECVIAAISDDAKTITLASPLKFDHGITTWTGHDRPMVLANRERSVVFRSENPSKERHGHVMLMRDDPGAPGMRQDFHYVAFIDLGRTNKNATLTDPDGKGGGLGNPRGRYGLHYHLCGPDTSGMEASVFGCYLDGSPGWGFVNHGSYVCMQHNVAYRVLGAHFTTENGTETGCMRSNVAIRSTNWANPSQIELPRPIPQQLVSVDDWAFAGHGFWTHCGGVQLTDNIAYGSSSHAFVFMSLVFRDGQGRFDGRNLSPPINQTIPCGFAPQNHSGNRWVGCCGIGMYPWGLNGNPSEKAPVARSRFSKNSGEAMLGGLFVGYSSNLDFEDCVFIGSQKWDRWSAGIGHSGVQTDCTHTRCEAHGYQRGHQLGTNLTHTITDCTYRSRGHNLYYDSPRPGQNRRIEVVRPKFLPYVANGAVAPEIVARRGEAAMSLVKGAFGGFAGAMTRWPYQTDVTTLDGKTVYYFEDGPDFIVGQIKGCPPELAQLTNAQLWDQYAMRVNAMLTPADTVRFGKSQAYISAGPPTLLPIVRANKDWNGNPPLNLQRTKNGTGYVVKVQTGDGKWWQSEPTDLPDKTTSVVKVVVDGQERGVLVEVNSAGQAASTR